MRRRAVAVFWIAGTTVPLLLATVFLVGCCVLPVHQVAHKLMPVCHIAAAVMRGDDQADDQRSVPARQKEGPAKRPITETAETFHLKAAVRVVDVVTLTATTAYRSFITLGALRCDMDVGLNVFLDTFLI